MREKRENTSSQDLSSDSSQKSSKTAGKSLKNLNSSKEKARPEAQTLETKIPCSEGQFKEAFEKKNLVKLDPFVEKKTELEELREKLKFSLDENLYLRAEFDNFKKRVLQEKSQLILYGGEKLISTLADEVLDDFDRAMFSLKDSSSLEEFKKGLEIIQKKLSQTLNRFGVQVIDPKGKAFDPSYQEALSYVKDSKVPEGHVAETFKKAYKLHGKCIRAAQVVLSKKDKTS